MKIIALEASNIKKLIAVSIKPDGNMVQITGKNGQGKTSVLDSIWWALTGAKHIQKVPIREGESQAVIKLDLGEINVTRTFKKQEGSGYTTSINVTSSEGAKFPSPQKILDQLIGELSFDPLAFSRMAPKERLDVIKKFVTDYDFEAEAAKNKADYDRRTDINRSAKAFREMFKNAPAVPESTPKEKLDVEALKDLLENSSQHNSKIATRKQRREEYANDVVTLRARIKELEVEMEEMATEADQKEAMLNKAEPLPAPVDISMVRAELDQAEATNKLIDLREQNQEHLIKAEELEAEAGAITAAIKAREDKKVEAIKAAKMPIKELSIGETDVVLGDIPFSQASDAQQLWASITIAMSLNPKLRVIRVRDGSLLDEDSLKLIADMAKEKDYQVWIERVDSSGSVGFVLEDGHIKGGKHEKSAKKTAPAAV